MNKMDRPIIADVWIQCPYDPDVRHKLRKGNHSPYYECNCLGIELGAELKEGDEVIIEELASNQEGRL